MKKLNIETGFSYFILALMIISFATFASYGQTPAGRSSLIKIETPHPYPAGDATFPVAFTHTIKHEGAYWIKIHFKNFLLAPGDWVSIYDGEKNVQQVLSLRGPDGDSNFWAFSVSGDTIIISLHAGPRNQRTDNITNYFGFEIDEYGYGTAGPQPLSICGIDDKYDARCFAGITYDSSRRVGRMLFQRECDPSNPGLDWCYCTGFLISCENDFLTCEHCINSQSEVNSLEVLFNYEKEACNGPALEGVQYYGNLYKKSDSLLDYSLLDLRWDPQTRYGCLLLSPRDIVAQEKIFIPQHPGGLLKEIAYYSDQDNGHCIVNDPDISPTELGYYCDTESGSSGSPVLDDYNMTIGLHQAAGCFNTATYIRDIFPEIQPLLTNLFCYAYCETPEAQMDVKISEDDIYGSTNPSLAWTGNEHGVAWEDSRDENSEIYFARTDSLGNKISPDIRITFNDSASYYPSLVWAGNQYGLSWVDYREGNAGIYFILLDSFGNKITSDTRISDNLSSSGHPSLAWAGDTYGVSWEDFRDGIAQIYFTLVDSSGNKVGSDIRVTSNAADSMNPSLCWAGNRYGISWEDWRDGNMQIYFARLDSSGNKLGSDLNVSSSTDSSMSPDIIWTGSEYGIAWLEMKTLMDSIHFLRLSPSGAKIGTATSIEGNAPRNPSLAWTGSEYGISWYAYNSGNSEIYFAGLDASGKKISSDLRVTFDDKSSYDPVIVWTGNDYGVSWEDYKSGHLEVYFTEIQCCDVGNPEICDYKDNDCDGSVDEGYATPNAVSGLKFLPKNKNTFGWTAVLSAAAYDTNKGNLKLLRSTLGDFSTTMMTCLEDNGVDLQATDAAYPSPAGEGFYYLVRAINDCRLGTYDEGANQIGFRDAEIKASMNACP